MNEESDAHLFALMDALELERGYSPLYATASDGAGSRYGLL